MKIAVIGSRSLSDKERLFRELEPYKKGCDLLISGGAKGTDTLAEDWARKNNIETLIFKPDVARYARGAYRIRNERIVNEANLVIAFWDGVSPGTKMVLNYCEKIGREVKVVTF